MIAKINNIKNFNNVNFQGNVKKDVLPLIKTSTRIAKISQIKEDSKKELEIANYLIQLEKDKDFENITNNDIRLETKFQGNEGIIEEFIYGINTYRITFDKNSLGINKIEKGIEKNPNEGEKIQEMYLYKNGQLSEFNKMITVSYDGIVDSKEHFVFQ